MRSELVVVWEMANAIIVSRSFSWMRKYCDFGTNSTSGRKNFEFC